MTYDEAVAYRFPFTPIDKLTARRRSDRCDLVGPAKLGHLLGIHHEALTAYRVDGLPWDMADRAATALEQHPGALWPEWETVTLAADDPQLALAGMDWI